MAKDMGQKAAGRDAAKAKGAGAGRLKTPTDLGDNAVKDIAGALNQLLADSFALYLKTKNFHWHVSGPHFRGYHLMLDEQAAQIIGATDDMAERARKLGGQTLKSIGQIAAMTTVKDNDADDVDADAMLAELLADNRAFVTALRAAHALCDDHGDAASAGMIEDWLDQTEKRVWFLYESLRPAVRGGH